MVIQKLKNHFARYGSQAVLILIMDHSSPPQNLPSFPKIGTLSTAPQAPHATIHEQAIHNLTPHNHQPIATMCHPARDTTAQSSEETEDTGTLP